MVLEAALKVWTPASPRVSQSSICLAVNSIHTAYACRCYEDDGDCCADMNNCCTQLDYAVMLVSDANDVER